MKPLTITAHLYSGFASSDPWSPSIDGIVAYWVMRDRLGPDEFALTQGTDYAMSPVEGLPFERVEHDGLWWYACSMPIYQGQATVRRHVHRRFDAFPAERYLVDTGKVQTQAGAYKNARIAVMQHITPKVVWHAIGDRTEMERWLRRCSHIGGRLAAGFGRVRRWEFGDGDADTARYRRPLPLDYARQHGISGDVMDYGIRPPVRIAANITPCIMPIPEAA